MRFDSALVLPTAPRPTETLADNSPVRSSISEPSDVGDIYTRSSGFRTMVTPANEPTLRMFRGIEDQVVPAAKEINLQVPTDAFVHTDANETVLLTATLADGTPLPAWLHFDGKAGTFNGVPPAGQALDLRVKVQGRDSQGREANAMFRIKSSGEPVPDGTPAEPGKTSRAAPPRGGLDAQLMRGDALSQRHGLWQSQRNGQGIAQRVPLRRSV